MNLFPVILTVFVLLLAVDVLRWQIVVGRELKRHGLVRVRAFSGFITPAKGYRLIAAYICERQGKDYQVIITNRGWLRTQPSVQVIEAITRRDHSP